MRELALASFRKAPNRYNCAQTIISAAVGTVPFVSQQTVDEHAKCGGGRCPEGKCGALWSAQMMVESEADKREIEREFVEKAGSVSCREILEKKKLTCQGCVVTAADFLERKYGLRVIS